ncbi:SusD/RagB family nutrient-binding outer membrane lipoprotein [Agriterribacter sp.]|uniref:SusD/RagB family nutrient-binding outer membrane lipoprotein n=1 Tax=Agriterribacter sp. TaxID=2821509 RepID=UPI002C292CEB|nr:SusD/RagB family nutrient-binding outer membrane lipoprotein [Agriterribacter sp.]HRN55542.1 SusD/RagB family nutrient-binding outer membrane lipoprotein [Agriterribacter sp.]HRP58584.1 SusD/RagB family nutrient-binding outer membrane lipoprotein [Agriterribacter sp.]
MKMHIKLFGLMIVVLSVSACTRDFEEMNTSPNSLTAVPYKTLITNSEISVLNTYNAILNEAVSWTHYNVRDVYVHDDRYQITGSIRNFNMYSGHLKNLKKAMQLAEKAGDNNAIAVIKILSSYAFQNLTDWYGDIPYSEALKADDADNAIIYPKYDPQQSIYADLIAQLKEANGMIDPAANIGSADVVFNGDMMMWKRFCNSLLLRMYMRISLVDASTAKAGIEMIASDPNTYPVINSNETAAFKYWLPNDAVYRSPYWMNPVLAASQENVTSAFMIGFLKSRNDPRLPVYAEPAANSGEYVGLPLGTLGQSTPDLSIMGIKEFRSANSPTRMMRYSEVLFIYAEAALNGWNVGMTAQAAYEAAIKASFDEYGLETGSYLTDPLVDFNGGTDQRELIGDQKWCALYPDGNQGWAEVRRSGYPVYVAVTEPVQTLYPGKGTIVRMPYPYSEAVSNPDGLAAAIAAQPGIIDEKFGAGVWWDVK